MASERITDIVDKQAFDQLIKLQQELDKVEATMAKVAASGIGKNSGGMSMDAYVKAANERTKATQQMTAAEKEQEKMEKQQEAAINKAIAAQTAYAGSIKAAQANIRKLTTEQQRLNLATEEGRKRSEELKKEIEQHTKFVKENADAVTKQRMNIGNYTGSIVEAFKQTGLFSGGVRALTAAQTGLSAATGFASKAFGTLKAAIMSTGIGALLIAFGSLIAYFKSGSEGANKMKETMAPLKVLWDNMKDALEWLGKQVAIFVGNAVSGFMRLLKALDWIPFINDWLKKNNEEMTKSQEIERQLVELRKEERELTVKHAKDKLTADELIFKAAQKNKYEAEQRVAFMKQALAIELQMSKDEAAHAEKKFKLTKQQYELDDLSGAQKDELAAMEAEIFNKRDAYFAHNRRNVARLAAFEKEAAEDKAAADQDALDRMGEFTRLTGITQVQVVADAENKTMALRKEGLKLYEKIKAQEVKIAEEIEEKKKQLLNDSYAAGVTLMDALFDRQLSLINQQKDTLEEQKEAELKAAGGNAEKKKAIEEKYAAKLEELNKKARKMEHDKALADRMIATAKIAFETGVAIAKAEAGSWVSMGMPWVGIFLAMQAAQIAAINAAPLPKYAKGRRGGPAETALVGEAGAELLITPGGQAHLVSDPTVAQLSAGTSVISNAELMAMAASSAFSYIPRMKDGKMGYDVAEVIRETSQQTADSIVRAIKDKQELHLNITEAGFQAVARRGHSWTHYLNTQVKL